MKNRIFSVVVLLFVLQSMSWAGLGGDKTMYVGGTVNAIKEGTEGKSSAKDEKVFVFEYSDGKTPGRLEIPYDKVDSLEYGQKAGRRIGVAVVVNPLFILSKKRRHFLTIGYKDANDKQQAVVLEMGKDVIRVNLTTLEARTGQKVEYQDEEARKSGKGN